MKYIVAIDVTMTLTFLLYKYCVYKKVSTFKVCRILLLHRFKGYAKNGLRIGNGTRACRGLVYVRTDITRFVRACRGLVHVRTDITRFALFAVRTRTNPRIYDVIDKGTLAMSRNLQESH